MLKENIVEHLDFNVPTLQDKVAEQNAIIEAHGQHTQAQMPKVNLDIASSKPSMEAIYAEITAQALEVDEK